MLLIDAVPLLDIFKQNSITDIITIGDKTIRQHVYDAPTIDAVPVVRCKDCKHAVRSKREGILKCGQREYDYSPDDGYCFMGERRGEEDE